MRKIISLLVIARLIQRLINGSRPRGPNHSVRRAEPPQGGQAAGVASDGQRTGADRRADQSGSD